MTNEENKRQDINIAKMQKDIEFIKEAIGKLCVSEKTHITKQEFAPIKKLYDKLVEFSFGSLIAIGTVAVGAYFWLKGRV